MSEIRKMNENVKFSNEFKRRVLKTVGDFGEVKKLLDNNRYFIGRYISDAIENCACGCTKDPTDFGKRQIELRKLYDAWDTYFFVKPYEKVVI